METVVLIALMALARPGDVAFQPGISAEDVGSEGRVPVLETEEEQEVGPLFINFSLASLPGATVALGWDFHVTDTTTISVEGELGYWQVDDDEVTKTFWTHDNHGKKHHDRSAFHFDSDNDIAAFMVKATVWQSVVTDDHLGWQVYAMLGVGGGDGMLWEGGLGGGYRWGDVLAWGGLIVFDGDAGVQLGFKLNF